MVTEQRLDATGEPTLRDLSEALIAVYGTDYGIHISHLDFQIHRCCSAGSFLPQGTGAAGG